jgi:mxaA protein
MSTRLSVLALVAFAPLTWAAAPVAQVQTVEPRAFGYTLGDVLERRVIVDTQAPYTLAANALPKPGRIGTWLELRAPELRTIVREGGTRYEIVFTYQLINAPTELKTLAVPDLMLELTDGAKPVREIVPEFLFTAAPLTPENILARGPLDEMQPDAAPPLLPVATIETRLIAYATAAAAILLFLACRMWGIPFIEASRGPFARAASDVKRLARTPGDTANREAIRRIHRAFDETAGRAVFADEVPEFLSHHPGYAALAPDIGRFFDLSRQEFFAGRTVEPSILSWLAGFCRECRAVERGSR